MILVRHVHESVRRPDATNVFIGRPSPLGNPYVINKDGMRAAVIRKYRKWLDTQIADRNPEVLEALRIIAQQHKDGRTVVLLCFCYPKACHGNVVKDTVETRLEFFTTPH